jgi:hypothetical protein
MKTDVHPFAINIIKLQRYNFNFFSIDEVVFFEYIVVQAIRFRKEFYHSSKMVRDETGIKKTALATIVNRFNSLGIITTCNRGLPKVKYYWVDFRTIIKLLPEIYLLQSPDAQTVNLHQQLLDYLIPPMEHFEERRRNMEARQKKILQKQQPLVLSAKSPAL